MIMDALQKKFKGEKVVQVYPSRAGGEHAPAVAAAVLRRSDDLLLAAVVGFLIFLVLLVIGIILKVLPVAIVGGAGIVLDILLFVTWHYSSIIKRCLSRRPTEKTIVLNEFIGMTETQLLVARELSNNTWHTERVNFEDLGMLSLAKGKITVTWITEAGRPKSLEIRPMHGTQFIEILKIARDKAQEHPGRPVPVFDVYQATKSQV